MPAMHAHIRWLPLPELGHEPSDSCVLALVHFPPETKMSDSLADTCVIMFFSTDLYTCWKPLNRTVFNVKHRHIEAFEHAYLVCTCGQWCSKCIITSFAYPQQEKLA